MRPAFRLPALLAAAVTLAVPGLGLADTAPPAAPPPAPAPPELADLLASMDRAADPCTDFYRYACGGWLDRTALPADKTRWARSFSVVQERNREIVRGILEAAAADPGGDPERRKVGDFWAACMDEAAVERAGLAPLAPWLAKIAAVSTPAEAMALAGELHRMEVGALFAFGVLPDFKDPGTNSAFMAQGGLGLPDRDDYLSDDPRRRELRTAYQAHVARMLELVAGTAGAPAVAAETAAAVVAFETRLAEASRTRTQMRDVEKLYHPVDRAGLAAVADLAWDAYLRALGRPDAARVNVATPEFFAALPKLLAETPAETLRAYLRWQLIHDTAPVLSREAVEADFAFFGATLAGQKEIEPRWKRCVAAGEEAFGEAIGRQFVAEHFAGDSKRVALEMIGDVETAFEASLPGLAWMDEATRKRALEKRDALANKIGYPDAWRDYGKLAVGRESHFANVVAATVFENERQLARIDGPVDRGEWRMTPQTVNASYNPLFNEISFPAGILQPPFFRSDFPAAVNYGGIGAVVGHELTHGFDDQGRKFDPRGRLEQWWAPEVATRFEERARCVADAYAAYEVEPGLAVNGELTLGENLADLGGIKQAYRAYKSWEQRRGRPQPVAGLTHDQLFFIAWGQTWCSLQTPESARLRARTDPHSPARLRAIGPPAHNPAFAEVFACPAGTPMNPARRCEVW